MITNKQKPALIPTGQNFTPNFNPSLFSKRVQNTERIARPRAEAQKAIRPRPNLEITDVELKARVEFAHHASAHFLISFDKDRFSDVEIQSLTALLESSYSSIFYLTHEAFADRLQVYVIDRRASGLLGRDIHSHFNVKDRALYLARSNAHSIRSNVVALLVHAMRVGRYVKHYAQTEGWTLMEDAFSILLQHRLASDEDIFPFFAVEPDIIAQHLISTRSSLKPLSAIAAEATTAACLEHVVLGGAFFTFLADTYSDDRIVEFSKCTDPINDETYKSFFGATLEELEDRWRQHIPSALMTLTHDEHSRAISHWEQRFELAN